ncbi:MAG: DMT family transporter [Deltaproteobacteria bacterium]|nr:DMT family transporter [Deltaproteobacteria bacterium]
MSNKGALYALACALCWAIAVILFRRSSERMSPLALNLFKNLVGLALLVATLPFTIVPPKASWLSQDTLWLMLSGLVGIGIADTLFFYSLRILGASRQALVDCLYAPMVVVCSHLMLNERLSSQQLLGGLAVAVAVLVADQPARPIGNSGSTRRGVAIGAIAIALMAIAIVAVKPQIERLPLVWSTTVRLAGGVFGLLGQLLIGRRPALLLEAIRPQAAWAFALPGALLGTYLALLFWIGGFKYTAASIAGILNQTSTLFIVVLAVAVLKEPFSRRLATALLLGLAGAIAVVA